MAKSVRYLIQRGGRFHARVVVPQRLRKIIGRTELSAPLGADRREALRKLPSVVAQFHDRLTAAEQTIRVPKKQRATRRANPLGSAQMARIYLDELLEADTELRGTTRVWAFGDFDRNEISLLRDVAAGRAHPDDVPAGILRAIEVFRRRGNHDLLPRGPDWQALVRQIALAELEAMKVIALRDDGDPDPPLAAMFEVLDTEPADAGLPLTRIRDIFDGYRRELEANGKGRNADHRWSPIIENLIASLGHDSARRLTRRDIIRWKDRLLELLSPKTVRDTYVATVRAAFNWGVDNGLLESNPAATVKVRLARKLVVREKGFTDAEALGILRASFSYQGSKNEHGHMTSAKRWSPILCAFTGARIAEITQLRAEDIKTERGVRFHAHHTGRGHGQVGPVSRCAAPSSVD